MNKNHRSFLAAEQVRNIRMIISDVDGVWTDGGVEFDGAGIESKRFHIRDGLGVKLWRQAGGAFAVLTGRKSSIVERRATELGVKHVRQGVEDKLPAAKELAQLCGCEAKDVCYIGDDLPDLPVIQWAGLGATVADAPQELQDAAAYTTRFFGGHGALRDLIEAILIGQGRWEAIVQTYRQ